MTIEDIKQRATLKRGVYFDIGLTQTHSIRLPGFGPSKVFEPVNRIRLEDGRTTDWFRNSDETLLSARVDLGVSVSRTDLTRALKRKRA